ncbi:zinc-finger domain-containing protein [Parvularcula lutaonensis]|uniref:Zinc-finger domain-containing protein n=1 Tax=Parvularcula lutaonensis TaxID=491923 RepID=A0ABV7MBP7_9PROT|nr:zinc-finger domain-containing protein [Parvularcula lutaonensis]GGY47189.1 hypothetical protein GCM10007148_15580 [Parvularcula lutaonensis]
MATKLPAHKAPRTLDQVIEEVVNDLDAIDIVFVDQRRQACMGQGGALGHPKVFYTIGDKGYAECMYCDRVFVYAPDRAGETIDRWAEREEAKRARTAIGKELPGDGLTESATPPPGENLGV